MRRFTLVCLAVMGSAVGWCLGSFAATKYIPLDDCDEVANEWLSTKTVWPETQKPTVDKETFSQGKGSLKWELKIPSPPDNQSPAINRVIWQDWTKYKSLQVDIRCSTPKHGYIYGLIITAGEKGYERGVFNVLTPDETTAKEPNGWKTVTVVFPGRFTPDNLKEVQYLRFYTVNGKKHPTEWSWGWEGGEDVPIWIDNIRLEADETAAAGPEPGGAGGRTYRLRTEDNPYLNALNTAYETPHTDWAKPYYAEPITVTAIAPHNRKREAVELAERFPFEFSYIGTVSYDGVKAQDTCYSYVNISEAENHLNKQLVENRADVMLIGGMSWNGFTEEQQLAILKRVVKGAGLVYVNPVNAEELLRLLNKPLDNSRLLNSTPWAILPGLKDRKDGVCLYRLGKGRVAILDYFSSQTGRRYRNAFSPQGVYGDTMAIFEYYQVLLGQSVVWASGRELPARVTDVFFCAPAFDRKTLPVANAVRVGIERTPSLKESSLTLQVTLRDYFGTEEFSGNVKPAKDACLITIPVLKSGTHFLECRLASAGKIIDFAAGAFTVTTDADLRIALEKPAIQKGTPVNGLVTLKNSASAKCELELRDSFDRLLLKRSLSLTGTSVPFSLPVDNPLAIMHTVTARLTDVRGTVIETKKEFPVIDRAIDNYLFTGWCGGDLTENIYDGTDYLVYRFLVRLYELGMDICQTSIVGREEKYRGYSERYAALPNQANLRTFPYMWRIWSEGATDKLERTGCLTDPGYLSWVKGFMDMNAEIYSRYSTIAYSLGDEDNFFQYRSPGVDVCRSATCDKDFVRFLKNKYTTLDVLNREWAGAYRSWDDAKPVLLKDALAAGNIVPWVDHRRHMEELFTEHFRFNMNIVQKHDPEARVGAEGFYPPTDYSLVNPWALTRFLRFLGPYGDASARVWQTFAMPGTFTSTIFGYYGSSDRSRLFEDVKRTEPWSILFAGNQACHYWALGCAGLGMDGDFSVYSMVQPSLEEIGRIKEGPGRILLDARKDEGEILLHYSQSSIYSDPANETGNGTALDAWMGFLQSTLLPYRVISYGEIETGALTKGPGKILVLPCSRSLSEKEAAAILKFAADGGLVIADKDPGVMNGNCRRLPEYRLADLFDLASRNGVRQYGRGKGVYLNGSITSPEVKTAALSAITSAKPKSWGTIENAGGRIPTGSRAFHFYDRAGVVQYVGIIKDYECGGDNEEIATVKFTQSGHIYEMRQRRYLGYGDRVTETFRIGEPKLFALLPARIGEPRIVLDKAGFRPGQTVTGTVRVPAGDLKEWSGIVQARIIDPAGNSPRYYSRLVVLRNGYGDFSFPLALNDAAGVWKVVFTEAVSGRQKTLSFKVVR